MGCCLANELGPKVPENQAYGQSWLAWSATVIVPDCCCFGGAWTSKMKPLSVPAWSWESLASHVLLFFRKASFHKWSCNFIFWCHSCQTLQHESIHVARSTTHPEKLALTPEPIHPMWTLCLGIRLQHTHSNQILLASLQNHPMKSQLCNGHKHPKVALLLADSDHFYQSGKMGILSQIMFTEAVLW